MIARCSCAWPAPPCALCREVDRAVLVELVPQRDAAVARVRALHGEPSRKASSTVPVAALALAAALVLTQCGAG